MGQSSSLSHEEPTTNPVLDIVKNGEQGTRFAKLPADLRNEVPFHRFQYPK